MVRIIGVLRNGWKPKSITDQPSQLIEIIEFLPPSLPEQADRFLQQYNHWAMDAGWPIWAVAVAGDS